LNTSLEAQDKTPSVLLKWVFFLSLPLPLVRNPTSSLSTNPPPLQWILSDNKTTAFIGCIGTDENGKRLRQEAESDGVKVHYMEDPTTPTGTCAVLIVNKDRSMVANLAAANSYKKTHFEDSVIQVIVSNAKIFYITGFFITVSPDTILAVAEHAKTNNKVFTMNLSAPFLLDFFWDEKFEKFLPYIDILFGNETEAAALGKRLNAGPDLKEIALAAGKLSFTFSFTLCLLLSQLLPSPSPSPFSQVPQGKHFTPSIGCFHTWF
jgi:hypothetical protein